MAHVRRVGRPGAYRYEVRWLEPDHTERSKRFATKSAAERHLISVSHAILAGTYVDPSAGRVTFRDYAEQWRALQPHRDSTARNVRSKLERHAYPAIGDLPLAAIRPSDLKAMQARMTCAPSTAAIVLGIVGTVFRAAVEDRVIAASPAGRPKPPKLELVEPLHVEHVLALIAATPGRYRALVALGAMSGLRIGELCGLTVDRFDALRRTVRVDRQLAYGAAGDGYRLRPPKTAAARRTVPITQGTVDELAAHLAAYGVAELEGERLIFSNEAGRPVQPVVFGRGPWKRAVRDAGVPGSTTPHDLRHFYASALIAHGESVTTVQRRLGHESATTTLRTYSHLWQDSDDRTRAAIEAAFASGDQDERPVPGERSGLS